MSAYRGNRKEIWDKTGGRCIYCGLHLTPDDENTITRGMDFPYASWMECDHFHPKRLGGSDLIENIVPSCQLCNSTKRTMTIDEYRHWISYERDGRPKFNAIQSEWLIANGFVFPPVELHAFWFETADLRPDLYEGMVADEAQESAA